MGFRRSPDSVVALAMERIAANGIRRVWILDPSYDTATIHEVAKLAKSVGIEEVVAALPYSISPVHTDEYYSEKTREIAKSPNVDTLYIKDASGLLTPDRLRTLVPKIQHNSNGLPLELHSHCNTGLAPLFYLDAVGLGVNILHTAVSPLANGSSQPSTENVLKNIRRLGYSANLDKNALESMADHFKGIAEKEGRPMGIPSEYDVYYYEHQIPGGMMSTLKRHLSEAGAGDRLEEVVEEIIQVRKDLGYPIMITPFSQFIASQATMNVISGERYKIIPDEIIEYAAGLFGEPPAPMNQDVLDKISSLPKAGEFFNKEFPQPSIKELRKAIGIGTAMSDEEFLLRYAMSDKEVDDMLAAGPIKNDYP